MVYRLEGKKVVGLKQTMKAINDNSVKLVYLANDAEEKIIKPVVNLLKDTNIEVLKVDSKKELGAMCGIDVGAAIACVLKE